MSVLTKVRKSPWTTPLLWLVGFIVFALFVVWNRDLYTFLRYLTLGLPQGAIIALIAVGYSMVYGIIQLINFAHGEIFMMSTYFAILLLVPAVGDNNLGINVITVAVGVMAACTAWVALSGLLANRATRSIALHCKPCLRTTCIRRQRPIDTRWCGASTSI